jgi:hypothetical protein
VADILSFPKIDRTSDDVVVWQCGCGCQAFYIYKDTGECVCHDCDGIHPGFKMVDIRDKS